MNSGAGGKPGSDFTVEPRDGYLYLRLAPGFEITADSMARSWIALSDACRTHNLRRVLVEGDNVRRRITSIETFDHAGFAAKLMPGLTVACVFRGFTPDQQTGFFRTVAMNRGVRTEFFQDLNEALKWLGVGT